MPPNETDPHDRKDLGRRREQEAKCFLAAIVESSEDSIITIDFDGTITTWNKAAELLYGYPAAEAIGKALTMMTLPEDLAMLLANIEKIMRGGTVEVFDTLRVKKNSQTMILSVVMSPVRDEAGKVIGVSTIARDLTERHAQGQIKVLLRRMVSFYADAITKALSGEFHCFLLDNGLPDSTGVELCKEIREFDEETPIIFYSGDAFPREIGAALNAGANEYLVKPVDPTKLERTVSELLTARTKPETDSLP